jgi:hypothetical protein
MYLEWNNDVENSKYTFVMFGILIVVTTKLASPRMRCHTFQITQESLSCLYKG